MIKQLLSIVLSCFISVHMSFAQNNHVSNELAFAQYLSINKQYDDQIFVLKSLANNIFNHSEQRDSIYFLLGGAYYNKQLLDSAILQYAQVSTTLDKLYTPSAFWKGYLESHLGSLDIGQKTILSIDIIENNFKDLKNFQLAGNALLKRNFEQFNKYTATFTGSHYQYAKQEKQLIDLQTGLINHKYKSPALAGLMSAIIPGSGKIYAGKVGQGLATIMATTIMGIQTYEGYRKDGANSPRFIIYASLLSSFYIANVWGSVISVNVRKREFDDTVNKEILFNMHIPLRTIFN